MTTYEEIVAMLNDASNAGNVCGIGILVEFPLSRPRFESPGVFVVKRGRRSKKPWKLRRVSLIILLKAEDSEIEPIHVSRIDWKNLTPIKDRESKGWKILIWAGRKFLSIDKFWRKLTFRKTSELPDGYSFYFSNNVIKIDSNKDTFNYWYIKSDKYNSLWDIKNLISSFRALSSTMEESVDKSLENFGFLSPCKDLEWLEKRFREYMPEPHKTKAYTARKNAADNKINEIQAEKSKLEQQIIVLENDLLEAKNEKRPRLRWFWKIMGLPIVAEIGDVVILFASVIIALFVFLLTTTIAIVFILIWALSFGSRKYYKKFSRFMSKWFSRYSRSETSRELATEKHYSN